MELPLSRAVAADLELLDECPSTNSELAARARDGALPDFSVLATTSQTAGRGRLGRTWSAPPGKTLAVSVLLLSPGDDRMPWLPLIAGLAMTRAVRSLVAGHPVTLKWPNDVQVDGLKISGLLGELVPGVGVVMGAGLNLTMAAAELPTPVSTSLTLVGASPDGLVDRALAAYLRELMTLRDALVGGGGDARAEVAAECSTIGRAVRVELPGGDILTGTATGLDEGGRLIVDGRAVAAGDVTHLRYA
jgi:BirA family transcriptional regulator, biotin operon repressor / biotin---[acetyl-CoA-carboxylase] ligase